MKAFKTISFSAIGILLMYAVASPTFERVMAQAGKSKDQMPIFAFDPTWPKMPLPNQWVLGNVSAVSVDAKDHIWILQRPFSVSWNSENGLEHTPPVAMCCRKAPPVIEFDQAGNVGASWGGPGEGYQWPEHNVPDMSKPHMPELDWSGEHGVYIDYKDHYWITNNGPKNDGHVLKFTREGKFLMNVGKIGSGQGSNDTEYLGKPAGIVVDSKTDEVFIADGYKNRRVIVFDADTGAYKRHWGAYGKPPDDTVKTQGCVANVPPPQQFSTVHAVQLSNDGLVYVSDRANCRIQVFKKDGTYVNEVFVPLATQGASFATALSADKDQRFIYSLDGWNKKVWILRRNDLKLLGSFGCPGHFAGCFYVPHGIAVDSKGNIYVADIQQGNRVQRFLYKGLGPAETP